MSVIGCCFSLSIFSQSIPNLVSSYDPVLVENPYRNPVLEELDKSVFGNSRSSTNNPYSSMSQKSSPDYQLIRGYKRINGNWCKINLKVFVKGKNVYVHGYQDRNSGIWLDAFNTYAQETTRYDDSVIYENFDYKARISGFMVYF